jgi:predicted Zn-dependent peptidase
MLDSYLAKHYRGPDMVLAAAGAVDHDALVTLAGDKLGAFAASTARKLCSASARFPARKSASPWRNNASGSTAGADDELVGVG